MAQETGLRDGENGDSNSGPAAPHRGITLRSLAPEYVQAQHSRYVRHLENAITDPKNKNIALTGRYGAGKSSVLDQFETNHKGTTLRISINTLGPDTVGEDLTNRIQKELVKQLVYRAKPGKLRRSRFARSAPLTWWRALIQAIAGTCVGLGLLWLLGLWPAVTKLSWIPAPWAEVIATVVFLCFVVLVVWAARWLVGDRMVSQFTTAGTTVTLKDRPDTYFDEFLDEIVAFFDAVSPQFVIFEDLDRFDDPRIFDSLRELNTIINASAHWKDKSQPLRFIYAIKDSLFEKLGVDPEVRDHKPAADPDDSDAPETATAPKNDLAAAALERANRTKFFELVIPVVPFISHRNARDHLIESLKQLGLPKDIIQRPLLDLVARHTTDMRLLINICNEFAVFCEHLLWVDKPAPGMTPDHLFALVAYKNFHLADFEAIPQRGSSLDALEQHHRGLVRMSIEQLQEKKRLLARTEGMARQQDQAAEVLGKRLIGFKEAVPLQNGHPYQYFDVAGERHLPDTVVTAAFWKLVADSGQISITNQRAQQIGSGAVTLGCDKLEALFPEGMDADRWRKSNARELATQTQEYDREIAFVRGADFNDLAMDECYTYNGKTFKDVIADKLKSQLARDLVSRGYITRNYAEYSSTFYGEFVGVDVAFYYNHSIQPNQMYPDYVFTTPNAIDNLLEQVDDDFTSSVSVLNIAIINHLLETNVEAAKQAVAFIVADFNSDAKTFLNAFLNATEASREELIKLLAAHPWRTVFDYLAGHDGIPDETTRVTLLNAALLSARSADAYDLNEGMRSLLADWYPQLSAFAQDQSPEQTDIILSFAQEAGLVIPDLTQLGSPLRERVIAEQMYELTAPNLRTALDISSTPTLEEVWLDDHVWPYCRDNIDQYLAAIRDDDPAAHVVRTPAGLSEAITEQHDTWTGDQLLEILSMSAPGAALVDLTEVPSETWSTVVDAKRVVPTVANVWTYVDKNEVDEHLAQFLVPDGTAPIELKTVEEVDDDARAKLAISLLNSSSSLHTAARVRLTVALNLPNGVEATDLDADADDLLAQALKVDLVSDTAETFAHFIKAGWESVADAFSVSANVEGFMSPELFSPIVADLLASAKVPDSIRRKMIEDLASYVPDDNSPALHAAGVYAHNNQLALPLQEVKRIANATHDPNLVLFHLVAAKDTSPEELVATLVLLGPPYSSLTEGPDTEFDLPSGRANTTLFKRLEKAKIVKILPKLRGKKVRNLI